jgi:hypothetical protein
MNEYPKWVQRAPDIGAVLCLNAAEEKQLLDDWAAEQAGKAKAAETAAAAEKALRDAEVLAQAEAILQQQAAEKALADAEAKAAKGK